MRTLIISAENIKRAFICVLPAQVNQVQNQKKHMITNSYSLCLFLGVGNIIIGTYRYILIYNVE